MPLPSFTNTPVPGATGTPTATGTPSTPYWEYAKAAIVGWESPGNFDPGAPLSLGNRPSILNYTGYTVNTAPYTDADGGAVYYGNDTIAVADGCLSTLGGLPPDSARTNDCQAQNGTGTIDAVSCLLDKNHYPSCEQIPPYPTANPYSGQGYYQALQTSVTPFEEPHWAAPQDSQTCSTSPALVLTGGAVPTTVPGYVNASTIPAGTYQYIIINGGTYTFGQGVFNICSATDSASLISFPGDPSTAGDFNWDVGSATDQPAGYGVYIGHGSSYAATNVSGMGVTFTMEPTSASFAINHNVTQVTLVRPIPGETSGATYNTAPIVIYLDNGQYVHIDGAGNNSSPLTHVEGIVYQPSSITSGGVELTGSKPGANITDPTGHSDSGTTTLDSVVQGFVWAWTVTLFGPNGANGLSVDGWYGGNCFGASPCTVLATPTPLPTSTGTPTPQPATPTPIPTNTPVPRPTPTVAALLH